MADTTISAAASLTASTVADGDLIPVLDISATAGSKASKMTVAELATRMQAVTPYNVGELTGDVTLDLANGGTQYGYISGNTTFQVPTGTPAECVSEITAIVRWANGAHTLDFHANIQRASDSAATFPKTLTAWKSYIFKLKYMGGAWCLVSLTGGFTQFVD